MKRIEVYFVGMVLTLVGMTGAGCGVLTLERKNFPNQALGAEGQAVSLDDICHVMTNTSAELQRDALRNLGIDDEDLLDVLVSAQVSQLCPQGT